MSISSSLSASFPTTYSEKKSHYGASDKGSSTADFNTFIKLLVTQMKNQDPSEPVDATQYISQLASFSAVEQATHTNTQLGDLGSKLDEILASNATMQAGNYVGKYVTNEDGSTCGIIKSVKIYADGLVATLDNGKELLIGPGVSVSEKKIEAGKAA